MIDIDDKFLW